MKRKKTKSADIKNKSILYFLIGLNAVLILFLVSMQSFRVTKEFSNQEEGVFFDENTSNIMVKKMEEKKPEEKKKEEPPKEKPKVADINQIKEVEKVEEVEEEVYEESDNECNSKLDSDNDGKNDCVDKCPYDPKDLCTGDGDGDGVPNHLDGCPQEKGPASNNGCPNDPYDANAIYPYSNLSNMAIHTETCSYQSPARDRICFTNGLTKMIQYDLADYNSDLISIYEQRGINQSSITVDFVLEIDGSFTVQSIKSSINERQIESIVRGIIDGISQEQKRRAAKGKGLFMPAKVKFEGFPDRPARTRYTYSVPIIPYQD